MRLVDQLVARAAGADAKAQKLADRAAGQERRREAFGRLGALFDKMAADGKLDRRELGDLMAKFRAGGLDTATLEQLYETLPSTDGAADIDAALRTRIGDQLRDAARATEDPGFFFEVQDVMSEYQQSMDLASRVSKAEHDAYMTAIRHMVA